MANMEPDHLGEDEIHYESCLRSRLLEVARSRTDVFRDLSLMEMDEVGVPKGCYNWDFLDKVKEWIGDVDSVEESVVGV